jgi:AraC-like DNA-binding protein
MSGLLREAVHRAAGWAIGPRSGAQAHLSEVVMEEIRNLPEESLGFAMPEDPRLVRIAEAMIREPADGRGLEAWAEWAHVPTRTLSRRFVVETGFTFTAWRQRARLLRSLELLAEGVAVTTIAMDLGYDNVSAFIAMFRRTFGVSPRRYGEVGR